MGRSRGGLTSEIHAVADTNALPATHGPEWHSPCQIDRSNSLKLTASTGVSSCTASQFSAVGVLCSIGGY